MFTKLIDALKATRRTIVFTEGPDARILEAADRLIKDDLMNVILIGNVDEVKAAAEKGGFDIAKAEIIDPATYAGMDEMVAKMVELRKGKMSEEDCRKALAKGNYFGTMLVKMGKADALLGGATYSTADTVRPALQLVKTKKGAHLVSSSFILFRKDKDGNDEKYCMGDCAINIDYQDTVDKATGEVTFTAAQKLAEVAVESARTAEFFGIDPKDAGRVFIDGKEAVIRKPLDAINAGIGFVTEDRKTEGLILCRDCKENISIAALRDFVRSGKLNLRREQKSCQDYVEKMHIKTPSLRQKVVNLSGGNQQKIVLAKWLMSDAKVLFLDEPTRGIDIGAKVEVYNIINEIAAAGKCVIVISSEMTELMGICDRIVVMCRGAITGEERKGQFTQESLMYLATGGSAAV